MGRETEIITIAAVFAALLLRFVRVSMIFLKCLIFWYRIYKNVLCWTSVQKSLVVILKIIWAQMFQMPTLWVWILTLAFIFNQKLGAHPSVLKSNWVERHFYSAVEIINLKSGWLVRNAALWIILSKAWYLWRSWKKMLSWPTIICKAMWSNDSAGTL